ncbi:MAG: helix-turn-helix transcriptional regulator, partial [Alphaproteobacteria bacterium]|nr:helix-turn-helix transcriptional regulator [Alphaproteobacteria bacterium]
MKSPAAAPKAKPKPKREAIGSPEEAFGLEPPHERLLLGWRIRSHRRANNWSLSDVSERTGLAVSTISKMERGQTAITFDTLMKMVRGLGTDLFDLLQKGSISDSKPHITVTRKKDISFMESVDYRRAVLCAEYPDKHMLPMMADACIRDIKEAEDWVQR